MSIYDYSLSSATINLLPPSKRQPNNLALLGVTDNILQRYQNNFFNDYLKGDNITGDWVSASSYIYKQRVRDGNSIYELITIAGITGITTRPLNDSVNWIKVLDLFVGARERASYTASKICVEFALNRYFKVQNPTLPFLGASHVNQIYIVNINKKVFPFLLTRTQNNSTSYLARNSIFSKYYLGRSYFYGNKSFNVNVPLYIWTPLGSNDAIREGIIRSQVDKYTNAGKFYNVLTY